MQRVSPTPLHLAKLTMLGAAVSIAAYAEIFLPFPHPLYRHGFPAMLWSVRVEVVCSLLPMMVGFAILYYNNYRLSSGINHLRFTDEELEAARRFVSLPRFTSIQVFALLVVVVLSVSDLHTHRFVGNAPLILLLAANPLNHLRASLGKRTVKPATIDWRLAKPLHSERWGQT